GASARARSCPTRRSSDLGPVIVPSAAIASAAPASVLATAPRSNHRIRWLIWCVAGGLAIAAAYFGILWWSYRLSHSITDDAFVEDRKSTRLNSSHLGISY